MKPLPDICEVVVDRRVLNGFKRRALDRYPRELYERIIGKIKLNRIWVYAFQDSEHLAVKDTVYIAEDYSPMADEDDDVKHSPLGTIHTHTIGIAQPSETDMQSAQDEGEVVMGICSIRKTEKRRFVSFEFYLPNGTSIPLTVSE